METIKTYEGEKPYIFVSYAHADAPAVMEVLAPLQERGFRIWYDEGIEVGSEWPEYIAEHLARSGLVLAFLSKSYLASDNCRREMHFALSRKVETVNVFLEETPLSPGMEMQIGSRFALMKYQMDEERFLEKLLAAPQMDEKRFVSEKAGSIKQKKAKKKAALTGSQAAKAKKKRTARRIVALSVGVLLLAACITLGIVGWATGLGQRLWILAHQQALESLPGDTVAVFAEPLLEQAARDYIGAADGELTVADLAGITELYIMGDQVSFTALPEMDEAEGRLQVLSDLVWFSGLRTLVVTDQPLRSLESLPRCGIEYLTVDCPYLSSLQGIGKLIKLREISTGGSPVTDLGDLEQCLQLRRLSIRGGAVSDFSAVKPLLRLAEVELSNAAINELRPILRLNHLTDAAFYSCDLRGSFFKSFDRERRIVSLTLVDCKLNSTAKLGDFTGLTTLRLIGTGEELDWSALASLPKLAAVYADSTTEPVLRRALEGSGVSIMTEER